MLRSGVSAERLCRDGAHRECPRVLRAGWLCGRRTRCDAVRLLVPLGYRGRRASECPGLPDGYGQSAGIAFPVVLSASITRYGWRVSICATEYAVS